MDKTAYLWYIFTVINTIERRENKRKRIAEHGMVAWLPLEGTVPLRCSSKGTLYNLMRVPSVAEITARLPEQNPGIKLSLHPKVWGGGRSPKGREVMLHGVGLMGTQMPPAGFMGTLKRRGINSPAPDRINGRSG